ncbi:heat-inducible transcription repressor HrcA [Pseudobutyrivibrio sp. YE44]|uniref:heat-inducible transcriptional repressor HrcA n=1 Tax=Pseudobutyrivibrio sp. YE44 TaxID=1520802 RepID=UPI00088E5059|nr:heat-inducible transcriptional repressor HrcA [Pseudobutyrivibrio sp. YE44]SDB11767.1 heat-inducible transcription repressor HrcA [Pseudobutyrivibrio sp. YE44]
MADTELDERKVKILNAIIKNYLETGEPVGSRTISKYTDLNLSSATIRNEMSDLEDLGYIVQPHTSAGRIPSDKGYRFYVNNLIAAKDKEVSEMQEWMIEKTEKMESLLKNVAKVLATNTQYATMISAPAVVSNRLKFVQLSAVDEHQVLSVVVMDGNIVKNKIIHVDKPLDNETLLKLNMLLNTNLNGLSVEQINLGLITRLKEQAGIHDEIVSQVLDTVADTITEDEDLQVYTSGATNIFKYPELSDSKKASELLDTFEEKQSLIELLSDNNTSEETGIQVYIGDESPISTMKDCSIVTATYELGDGVKGTIGIVGPKRMDYENVVDNIKSLKGQLDKLLKNENKKET